MNAPPREYIAIGGHADGRWFSAGNERRRLIVPSKVAFPDPRFLEHRYTLRDFRIPRVPESAGFVTFRAWIWEELPESDERAAVSRGLSLHSEEMEPDLEAMGARARTP